MIKEKKAPSWTIRRRIINVTLAFCAIVVMYSLWNGEDLRIYDTAITMSFTLAGSIIGGYIFGAVWESIRMQK